MEHFHMPLDKPKNANELFDHYAHCFDYLRQGIICAADSTLEGLTPEGGSGWGVIHRQCKDFDRLKEWADQNAAFERVKVPGHDLDHL